MNMRLVSCCLERCFYLGNYGEKSFQHHLFDGYLLQDEFLRAFQLVSTRRQHELNEEAKVWKSAWIELRKIG